MKGTIEEQSACTLEEAVCLLVVGKDAVHHCYECINRDDPSTKERRAVAYELRFVEHDLCPCAAAHICLLSCTAAQRAGLCIWSCARVHGEAEFECQMAH